MEHTKRGGGPFITYHNRNFIVEHFRKACAFSQYPLKSSLELKPLLSLLWHRSLWLLHQTLSFQSSRSRASCHEDYLITTPITRYLQRSTTMIYLQSTAAMAIWMRRRAVSQSRLFKMCLSLLLLSVMISSASGLTISFCSSQNTGSDFQSGTMFHPLPSITIMTDSWLVYNLYQSNGACQTTCQATYAYAILKGSDCWCSNYAPGDTTSAGSCAVNCPGFPLEKCGNPSQDLYGYYQLKNAPSGTLGATSSTPTPTPTPTPSPSPTPSPTPTPIPVIPVESTSSPVSILSFSMRLY